MKVIEPILNGLFNKNKLKTSLGAQFKDDSISHELEADIDKPANVIENKTEKKETPAPQLYNLNAVQKDAFKFYGLSADDTLNIIQKLYEEYKCVSYPRTPSKVMGSRNVELCRKIFEHKNKFILKNNL